MDTQKIVDNILGKKERKVKQKVINGHLEWSREEAIEEISKNNGKVFFESVPITEKFYNIMVEKDVGIGLVIERKSKLLNKSVHTTYGIIYLINENSITLKPLFSGDYGYYHLPKDCAIRSGNILGRIKKNKVIDTPN